MDHGSNLRAAQAFDNLWAEFFPEGWEKTIAPLPSTPSVNGEHETISVALKPATEGVELTDEALDRLLAEPSSDPTIAEKPFPRDYWPRKLAEIKAAKKASGSTPVTSPSRAHMRRLEPPFPSAPKIPKIGTRRSRLPGLAPVPAPPPSGRSHHTRNLARDARDISALVKIYEPLFLRPQDPGLEKLWRMLLSMASGRTRCLVRSPSSTPTKPRTTAKTTSSKPARTRSPKRAQLIRPAPWEDASGMLKATLADIAMKLLDKGYTEDPKGGRQCVAFTLNLNRDYERQLKAAYLASKADPKRQHPASILRRDIERHVARQVGYSVTCALRTETSPKGNLHVHGVLSAWFRHADKIRTGLREAGRPWDTARQFQADVEEHPNAGWAIYRSKEQDEWSGVSASAELSRFAKQWWKEQRPALMAHHLANG